MYIYIYTYMLGDFPSLPPFTTSSPPNETMVDIDVGDETSYLGP